MNKKTKNFIKNLGKGKTFQEIETENEEIDKYLISKPKGIWFKCVNPKCHCLTYIPKEQLHKQNFCPVCKSKKPMEEIK